MNPRSFFTGRAIGLLVVLGIVALVAGFYALNTYIYQEKQGDGEVQEPYRATLSGAYVCLPHVGGGDVETMECAFGLQTDAGEYYAIDFNLMSQAQESLSIGDRISASGVVTPLEWLSADHWQQYPIEGIFSVTDSLEVE